MLARRLVGLLGLLVLLGASASTSARAGGAGMNAGDCPPEGMASCGNPISVALGNKIETVTDYTSAGPNPLTFARYYNSFVGTLKGSFGNWSWTYDRYISVSSSEVDLGRPDGKAIYFFPNGSGGWGGVTDFDLRVAQVNATTWTVTDENDNVETYAPAAGSGSTLPVLLSIRARNGYTQTMTYTSSYFGPQLAGVTDSYGRTLTIVFSSSGGISSVTTPDGLKYNYTYSSPNSILVLSQVIYPTSPATSQTYLYEDSSFVDVTSMPLTGVIDENGSRYATWGYDDNFIYPIAISSQHAGGADLTTLAFSQLAEPEGTTVTNALGLTQAYKFYDPNVSVDAANEQYYPVVSEIDRAAAPGVAAAVSRTTYDSNGYIASETDWNGNVTTYVNDAHGDVTSQTVGSGTPLAQTTTTTWHSTFHLPLQITQQSRTVSYTYDSNGNALTKTIAAPGQSSTWSYTYNATGEVLTATDPLGRMTSYAYDAKGELVQATNALGQVTSITSHDANSRPLTIQDPNGLVTTLTYNFRGQITSRSGAGQVTTYGFDAVGQLTKLTQPDGSYLTFTYDAAHRLVGVTDALGRRIVYTLDAAGDLIQAQTFGAANNGQQTHSYAYDSLSRLVKSIGAQNQTTTYAYDNNGNITQMADPYGWSTRNLFDAIDRMVQSTNPLGDKTTFAYDQMDRLSRVTDPRGLVTSYSYSGMDLQIAAASPDAGNGAKTYDAAGNALTVSDGRGQTTTYSYDALNRVTMASPANGTPTTYRYDQGTNGIGRLTSMTDPSGTTTWSYNINGQVVSVTQKNGSTTLTTLLPRDAAGRIASMTYPSGAKLIYSYDADGNVSKYVYQPSTGSAITLIGSVTYFPFGPLASWVDGNGSSYVRTFDQDGRIANIAMPANDNMALTYDLDGRITSIAETGLPTKTIGYNTLGRVTSYASGGSAENFTYDPNGNRTYMGVRGSSGSYAGVYSYKYAGGSNRLLGISGAVNETFGYDASGNIIAAALAGSTTNYTYDANDRMSQAANGVVTLQYATNGIGQRVSNINATSGGSTAARVSFAYDPTQVNFVYDELGHPIGEYDQTGAALLEIVWLGDSPVAVIQGGAPYYVAPDYLDAPHQIVDGSGAVVWFWDHDPFGQGLPTGGFSFPLRFPGQIYNAATGLYYNGFRDYNPATGRYVESDPIGLGGGTNTYAYVGGDPIGNIDPFGLYGVQLQPEVPQMDPRQPKPTMLKGYCSKRNGNAQVQQYAGPPIGDQTNPELPPTPTPDPVVDDGGGGGGGGFTGKPESARIALLKLQALQAHEEAEAYRLEAEAAGWKAVLDTSVRAMTVFASFTPGAAEFGPAVGAGLGRTAGPAIAKEVTQEMVWVSKSGIIWRKGQAFYRGASHTLEAAKANPLFREPLRDPTGRNWYWW